MDRSRTQKLKIDLTSITDKATKDAMSKLLDGGSMATTIQSDNGNNVPVRYNNVTNSFEVFDGKKWNTALMSSSNNSSSPQTTKSSWPNNFIVPDVKTKITYDAYGLVTSGEDAEIEDITGLTTALNGKSDTGHTHSQSEVTNLVNDLSGKASSVHSHVISDVTGLQSALDAKAETSADGHRLKVYDTGTSSWVYITCTNGVLSVTSS